MFFKNHSINIKVVKDAKEAPVEAETKNPIINDETVAYAKDLVKHVGLTVLAVGGASIALKTLGSIAVVVTEAAVNNKKNED